VQVAVGQNQPFGAVELIHQAKVVGGDDDRGAGLVQFHEQTQQAARQCRIDVAGRLVGEQQIGLDNERTGDGGALLLTTGHDGWEGMDVIAEADPLQQFHHLGAVGGLLAALHKQRQRDVLICRQMIEQAEFLEHHADAPAHGADLILGQGRGFAAEQGDEAAGRGQRHHHQAQQRGLSRTGGAGQELERLRLYGEGNVLQRFRPHAVAQPDILESDQNALLLCYPPRYRQAAWTEVESSRDLPSSYGNGGAVSPMTGICFPSKTPLKPLWQRF
jgi:hypothetical protein